MALKKKGKTKPQGRGGGGFLEGLAVGMEVSLSLYHLRRASPAVPRGLAPELPQCKAPTLSKAEAACLAAPAEEPAVLPNSHLPA